MVQYWERKQARIRLDIEHIKRHLAVADADEAARLQRLKAALADELATCYEALDKLAI